MSVGPIEVMRAQEATQIKHIDSQKLQHAQESIARNFQETVQQEQSRPTQAVKADNNEYRYDAKEKGNNQNNGSKSKKDNKDKKKSNTVEELPRHGIDIRI